MALNLENLDKETREQMLKEIELDQEKGILYISGRLTDKGKEIYTNLLKEAAKTGNDNFLAQQLKPYMAAKEQARKPGGGIIVKDVPYTANETLAEGEFNSFYIRGLCSRAIEEDLGELEIYRAKEVDDPRPESQALIGKIVNAPELLKTLRDPESKFKAIPKPNSGLSVRIKK